MLDRILVFGDSISYGKWDKEGGWVARLRKYIDTKYNLESKNDFQVYNLGVPGELAINLPKRVEAEIETRTLGSKFGVLVIFATGVNDSCPNNFRKGEQTPVVNYKKVIERLIKLVKKRSCEVVFIGLTPANPQKSKGKLFTDEEIKKYDQCITEVCSKNKVNKLELFDDLKSMDFSELLVDAVHPNTDGQRILGEKVINFLKENFDI